MNTLYAFTVPVFAHTLGGLKNVLTKAAAQLSPDAQAALLKDALAPDMFTFTRQVQSACDNAKAATARLAGIAIPSFADDETTLEALVARIEKTLAFLATVDEAAFTGAAERQVELSFYPGKYLTGFDYAREHAMPNFFFHAVTAYGLVRKNGVTVGKADYLNGLTLHEKAA